MNMAPDLNAQPVSDFPEAFVALLGIISLHSQPSTEALPLTALIPTPKYS